MIWDKLLGQGLASPIDAVGRIIDDIWTNDEERMEKQVLLERLRQKPHIAQVEINKIEAGHRSLFVAGWRPFIGWVCGSALAWHFIFYDLATWAFVYAGSEVLPPKLGGTEHLISIVMALLGLGAMRTFEKFGGKTK